MSWVELLGYAASVAVLLTFCMSTMIPLRILALTSNVLFILYGYFDYMQPVLILHATLLPVNLYRPFPVPAPCPGHAQHHRNRTADTKSDLLHEQGASRRRRDTGAQGRSGGPVLLSG